MTKYTITFSLLLATLNSQAQTADKIDRYLLSAQEAYRFNGVALVAQKGQVIFHKANGFF